MRTFKEKKAEDTAKELLEEKMQIIKEKNEDKAFKVAQRKAIIEAQKEKKRKELFEREKVQMTPMHGQS